jgi:hypothetical protein
MKPSTSVFLKNQCVAAGLALFAAAIQWYDGGLRSALFIFAWVFVLMNIPFLWLLGKGLLEEWWRRRRP